MLLMELLLTLQVMYMLLINRIIASKNLDRMALLLQIGVHVGSAEGQFKFPLDVTVFASGVVFFNEKVFVSDTSNNRIQVFFWEPDIHPGNAGLQNSHSGQCYCYQWYLHKVIEEEGRKFPNKYCYWYTLQIKL